MGAELARMSLGIRDEKDHILFIFSHPHQVNEIYCGMLFVPQGGKVDSEFMAVLLGVRKLRKRD